MRRTLIIMMGIAICFASCQDENDNPAFSAAQVTIDPIIAMDGITARATEVNFEDNDQIGLSIIKNDGTKYVENSQMKFSNGLFTGALQWYNEANDASKLIAYYPYSSSGVPATFVVALDQTTTGFDTSDLMGSNKEDVLPSVNSVSMVFKHMLTKIMIQTTNESGSDITTVALKGSIPTAKVDFSNFTAEVDKQAAASDIVTQLVEKNKTYRAIIVPQVVAFVLEIKTATGKTLEQKLASTTLKQGGQYTINVRVLQDKIDVTISGEIENWTDEGEIPTEGDTDQVPFEEHTDHFMYDNARYEIITLENGTTWMTTPLRYIPKGYTPSSDPLAESHIWYPYKFNMSEGNMTVNIDPQYIEPLTDGESVARLGYLYDPYVAFGGVEITPENCFSFEEKRGICPPGWHIPTRAEYFDLCGNSNPAVGESGNQQNPDALFYDKATQAGKIDIANEKGFNYNFSGVRMQTNLNADPRYQSTVICGKNSTKTNWYSLPALNWYMSSTCYKTHYLDKEDPTKLTNIQFFGLMSTFTTSGYPEGKLSLAYIGVKCGQSIRCVKDK